MNVRKLRFVVAVALIFVATSDVTYSQVVGSSQERQKVSSALELALLQKGFDVHIFPMANIDPKSRVLVIAGHLSDEMVNRLRSNSFLHEQATAAGFTSLQFVNDGPSGVWEIALTNGGP
jgi:hypothetical protein